MKVSIKMRQRFVVVVVVWEVWCCVVGVCECLCVCCVVGCVCVWCGELCVLCVLVCVLCLCVCCVWFVLENFFFEVCLSDVGGMYCVVGCVC